MPPVSIGSNGYLWWSALTNLQTYSFVQYLSIISILVFATKKGAAFLSNFSRHLLENPSSYINR